ncbi:LamG-like jellyroll fold domain-containing protein [Micromonospora sp. NPDC047670]|uniref:LamG domain-containing protein n=1 Tax=Micromonospora sp. NPDC047670 TaxID=3364252 RepID=UPI00371A3608
MTTGRWLLPAHRSRCVRLLAGAAAASVAAALLAAPVAVQGAAAATRTDPSVAPDAGSAAAVAVRSGRRVEVASARTELSQVFANPSGGFTVESAVVPQRVKRSDGSWAEVDLSLRRGADGWRPVASVADVRFSDGGAGAAVTLVRRGRTLSLSWPGGLPRPSVSGDAATYAGVLPDVDLVLRATRTGFTHVFVVKSARAAANPALRELRFDLGGDARVVRGADGRLSALAGNEVLASAEPAVMWDSNDTSSGATARSAGADRAPAAGAPAGGGLPSRSSAAAPGDAAKTAPVGVEVAGGDLVLRPDAKLLAADAAFPVYIDPAWSTGKSRWAYATNNNTNNTDTTVARVGRDPDSGKLYRSFFDFPLTAMRGKHIESAYVQMKLDHSWSCGNTPTYMYHSGGIASTPRTGWSPKLNSLKASASSHANEGYGCADSPQPDMTVNFTGSAVTSVIQSHATSNATNITFAFCACSATDGSGESTTDRWKKFWPSNAKLVVDYDNIPGQPHSLQAGGVACPSGTTITLGTLNPTFSAIYPDADNTQALTTAYEWVQVPVTGVIDAATPRRTPPAGASVPAGQRSTTAAVTVSEGVTYAFRAKATDPAPYSRTSAWSGWCQFKIDTGAPTVGASLVDTATVPLPGSVVTFRLTADDRTVTKFLYGWNGPTTEVPVTGGAVCLTRPPLPPTCRVSATVSLTVPKYGLNILHVSAKDEAGNPGFGSEEFKAGRPTPAVARWGLETYPGVTATRALQDDQPSLGGDSPLSGGSVSWTGDLRLIRGETASFNGTSSALSTTAKVVDTTESFSVAGWVRLASLPTTADMVVASQEGTSAAGFHLGTRLEGSPATPRWSFLMKDTDLQSSTTRAASSSAPLTTADVGRWTHIAGVYDQTAGKVRLYVNGALAAEVDRTATAWSANGKFTVGRGWNSGTPGNWFKGNLADVQVYDRILVDHDFTGQLAEDPNSGGYDEPGMLTTIQVGDWDFSGAQPCYVESTDPSLCSALEAGQFGRRLALTQGVNVGDDGRGQFLALDRQGVDDPAQATSEFGRSQDNTADPQNPVWQDGRVLRTDQSFTVSAWVRPDALAVGNRSAVTQIGTQQSAFYLGQRGFSANGTTEYRWSFTLYGIDDDDVQARTIDAAMTSSTISEDDRLRWTHLVGVYDTARREVRLYVNGRLEGVKSYGGGSFTGAFDATGPLVVGAGRYSPPGEPVKWVDHWQGDIDDVGLYQGAMSNVAVKTLFNSQSPDVVEPPADE